MSRLLVSALLLVTVAAQARVTVQVTSCGQVVHRGEVGILMNDLDCGRLWGYCRSCVTCFPPIEPSIACASSTDCPDPVTNDCYENGFDDSVGVWVNPGGRLYLNGHSIGRVHRGVYGVLPDGTASTASIRVYGPGTIQATSEGVNCVAGRVTNIALHDNDIGVFGVKIRLKDVDASANSTGVDIYGTLRASGLVADDCRYAGVFSYEGARLSRSHLTGSGEADIASEYPPRVANTVCDHSAEIEFNQSTGLYGITGPPFGICSGD